MEPGTVRDSLADFVKWRVDHLTGDEKGEAAIYLERLFQAFGHAGIREAGATLEARIHQMDLGGVSYADLLWKPRCLIEMKRAGTDLNRHFRQAFQYWMNAVPDRPRYVILCNFDELWVYDFDNQLDAPMDVVKVEDLPQRYEALTFLLPEPAPPIFGNDLVQVTREAAAKVSGVFRSVHGRGVDRLVAQHFVLQSVVAMFSEDIGLLPNKYFTRTVEESRTGRDAYDLLGSLFREMNTPGNTKGGRFVGTPYFNGGLFKNIDPIELTNDELQAMRDACSTDWSAVRPEIFGTLFETSMDKDERHAYGAHFTSPADIAKVVLPTIVQPWSDRIARGKVINDFERILLDMANFRVLDPACGSGNFLYVAYREMRRLEAEAKLRILDRTRGGERAQEALSYVTPDHFLGIDSNPFAVEVAKVTMMLAKKLAADELNENVDALPLDNLDGSIQAADALFTPWPEADVIIGNPPYLGRRKMVEDLGSAYCERLATEHPKVGGVSDFVTYWFPIAHDALPDGGRAGFVATQAIRDNDSRKASLDYIVDNDGVIFDAVSSQPWSGDAVVHVSIVNWIKGSNHAPKDKTLWLDAGQLRLPVDRIPATLRAVTDVTKAVSLGRNKKPKVCFQGQTNGKVSAFRLTRDAAAELIALDPGSASYLHPLVTAKRMLHSLTIDDVVIDLPHDDAIKVAQEAPGALAHLRARVLADRTAAAQKEAENNAERLASNPKAKPKNHHQNFLNTWWAQSYRREDMLEALKGVNRYLAVTRVAAKDRMSVYQFVDPAIRPDDSLAVFALDDDYSFGVLSSQLHRAWFDERCSKLKVDPRYTSTTVWDSFPWPADPAASSVAGIARVSADIIELREDFMKQGIPLGQQYDALRTPGHARLRDLHNALDEAVIDLYGFSRGDDLLAQLLALNLAAGGDPDLSRTPGGARLAGSRVSSYRLTAEPLA